MELKLKRIALRDTYTIGNLYVDNHYFCNTIEDVVRDLNKDGDLNDAGEGKVYGKTAIPYGRYEITMKVQSPKYSQRASYAWCKGYLPRLCVGENKVKGKVINSMATLKRLVSILKHASDSGEKIWITIE